MFLDHPVVCPPKKWATIRPSEGEGHEKAPYQEAKDLWVMIRPKVRERAG
jgi:hypothetical protein